MDIENMFYIKEKDWYKLQAWAQLSYDEDKNEISGLMTAIPQEDGRFLMGDVDILKQENTSVETDIDADSVMEYKMKYGMKYNNPNMKFVWWHSHHNMGVGWSGTDINEINQWKNNSFSLALVINLREEYTFRVSLWNCNGIPMEKHIDTSLTIERKDSNEFGYIKMTSADDTDSYLFVANDGTLRIHSSAPTADGDGGAV